MADIDIVPKHRSGNLWLWIVLAIVIVAVLWFALGRRGATAHVGMNEGAPAGHVVALVSGDVHSVQMQA